MDGVDKMKASQKKEKSFTFGKNADTNPESLGKLAKLQGTESSIGDRQLDDTLNKEALDKLPSKVVAKRKSSSSINTDELTDMEREKNELMNDYDVKSERSLTGPVQQ